MKKKVTILLKEMMEALASMAKAKSLSLSLQTRISALKLRLMVFSLLRDRRLQVGPVPSKLHSLLNRRHHHHQQKLEKQQMKAIHDGEVQFQHGGGEDDKRNDAVVLFYCDGDSGTSEASVLFGCDGGKSEASVLFGCDGDGGNSEAGASNLAEAEPNREDIEEVEKEEETNPVSEEWLEEAAVATAATEPLEDEDALKVLDELEFVVEGGDDGAATDFAGKVFDEMEFPLDSNGRAKSATHQVFDEIESDVEEEEGGGGDWVDLMRKSKEKEDEFELEDKIDEVADLFIKRFHEQMRLERSPIHQ